MDLQRWSQRATIGSFFVALIALGFVIWPIAPSVPAESQEPSALRIEGMATVIAEWLPIVVIAAAVLGGGYMHIVAMRMGSTQHARIERVANRKANGGAAIDTVLPNGKAVSMPYALSAPVVRIPSELEMFFQRKDDGLFAVVKNLDHKAFKKSIVVEVIDMQRWSPDRSDFYDVPEVRRSPLPAPIRQTAGDPELYFDRKQHYRVFEATDAKSRAVLKFTKNSKPHTILMGPGTWLLKMRLAWNGQTENAELFIEWSGPGVVPNPRPDPRIEAKV